MSGRADPESVRRARGREIARSGRIAAVSAGWSVRSPGKPQAHIVRRTHSGLKCSCDDFEERNAPCKHVFAVLTHRAGNANAGEVPEVAKHRTTYPQDWPAYNEYQAREGEWFPVLLKDLCELLRYEPEGPRFGRPRIELRDAVFAATMKVYSNLSARRCMPDIRAAQAQGHLDRTPSYNATLAFIQDEGLTPILERLIAASSTPLKGIEHDFAVDATGFGTRRYYRHYSPKRDDNYDKEDVVKLHACVGVTTHIVARASVTPGYVNDHKEFSDLVESTRQVFEFEEVSADKAYLSFDSVNLVDKLGGTPFIPFKKNSRDHAKATIWSRMYHHFSARRDEFLAHYHKRSNVESAFSSLKRKFSEFLRNKTFQAQQNELLLKVLAYNITCVTQAMYELGVDPTFRMPAPVQLGQGGAGAVAGKWRLL